MVEFSTKKEGSHFSLSRNGECMGRLHWDIHTQQVVFEPNDNFLINDITTEMLEDILKCMRSVDFGV